MSGRFQVDQVILGEDFEVGATPEGVCAAVYYPSLARVRDHRASNVHDHRANPLHVDSGSFPVLLYAHAFRNADSPSHPYTRDFTTVDAILSHVAAYGCVCVAPDLSQIPVGSQGDPKFEERGWVIASYCAYLDSLNATLFANQLDLSRIVLVGHSAGAGGATHAGRIISGFGNPKVRAYGLIAPEIGGDTHDDIHPLLVVGGTLDIDEAASPFGAYSNGGKPKTLVMIPGANHFGYTDICPPDNSCNSIGIFDENGTISRDAQQQTAAAYLAALVRYFALGDAAARSFLAGEQIVPEAENFGVTGIQVESHGFDRPMVPWPSPANSNV
jgi:hypothetical protein